MSGFVRHRRGHGHHDPSDNRDPQFSSDEDSPVPPAKTKEAGSTQSQRSSASSAVATVAKTSGPPSSASTNRKNSDNNRMNDNNRNTIDSSSNNHSNINDNTNRMSTEEFLDKRFEMEKQRGQEFMRVRRRERKEEEVRSKLATQVMGSNEDIRSSTLDTSESSSDDIDSELSWRQRHDKFIEKRERSEQQMGQRILQMKQKLHTPALDQQPARRQLNLLEPMSPTSSSIQQMTETQFIAYQQELLSGLYQMRHGKTWLVDETTNDPRTLIGYIANLEDLLHNAFSVLKTIQNNQ